MSLKLTIIAAGIAAPIALTGSAGLKDAPNADDGFVRIREGALSYRLPGEFTSAGRPVEAPVEKTRVGAVSMMRYQVTNAEYARCVADRACAPTTDPVARPDRPAVKISWRDAEAYAAWLSRTDGAFYRLPTDAEWVAAAGSRFNDEPIAAAPSADPSRLWLARYEQESARRAAADPGAQPPGHFGVNENGFADLAGNVWEWTSTCYRRLALDTGAETVNCGVRVVEGRHRGYMTDFIRDPRSGGCAVGTPPENLGFRLVREENAWIAWRGALGRLFAGPAS
jgi:formylglycine-generating enzyme required for sulfatase activity